MYGYNLSEHDVDQLLTAAIAAPSMHNTQPWRFRVTGSTIDVHLDRGRALPEADPTGRAQYLSVGAVVFNLRCRAAAMGLLTRFTWLPERRLPDLISRVTVERSLRPLDPTLVVLSEQVGRRHTFRGPMRERHVPSHVLDALRTVAAQEGASLTVLAPPMVQRLLLLTGEADVLDSLDEERLREQSDWTGGTRADEGVPSSALGPRPTVPGAPVRDLGMHNDDRKPQAAEFELHPTLAILSTAGDGPVDWLNAGAALQRVLLTITRHGLSASFLNQPLERPNLRLWVGELVRPAGFPHMVLRVGQGTATPWGRRETSEPTPRRPLHAFFLPSRSGPEPQESPGAPD
jgi:nitroreductase